MAEVAGAFMKAYDVPGFGVGVARAGRVLYDEAFGLADATTGETLTPAHRFRIASLSKPVTSAAIFTLIERKKLRLDDRVFGAGAVLGERYGAVAAKSRLASITLRHLLTHTAGGWPNDQTDPMFAQPKLDHAALIAWTLANRPLTKDPGVAFSYSNFGYCLLGRVIEAATDRVYADYVQETVLRPTGALSMSIAGNSPAERQPPEVRYHRGAKDDPYGPNVRRMDSHGGWIAPAASVVRFASGFDRLLQPATLTEVMAPSSDKGRYAKGWRVAGGGHDSKGRLLPDSGLRWHTGHLPGTTALLVRARAGLCWAALLNTRHRGDDIDRGLDRALWAMVRSVPHWQA